MGDRLATIEMGRKVGGGFCALLRGAELGPHLTQCRLDRSLPPYQVASWWSIQPFGHNRHRPRLYGRRLAYIRKARKWRGC